jgi:hypothetical protein
MSAESATTEGLRTLLACAAHGKACTEVAGYVLRTQRPARGKAVKDNEIISQLGWQKALYEKRAGWNE